MTKGGVVPPRTSVAVAAQLTLVAAPSTSVPGGPLCYRMMVRRPLLPYISQPILPHVSSQRDQSLCATFYCLRLLVGPNLRVSILTRASRRPLALKVWGGSRLQRYRTSCAWCTHSTQDAGFCIPSNGQLHARSYPSIPLLKADHVFGPT